MGQVITPMKLKILVAPLDWGLGHATRCIPVIQSLLRRSCTVFLAGEGSTKSLLQKEFPQLKFLPLEGYRITYTKNKLTLPFSIATQVPKIISAIKNEQQWLQNIIEKFAIDAVISDNRYGLHHPHIPCVFMKHQLNIKTSFFQWADGFLKNINYQYINQFSECWVPDGKYENNLAGKLSHPAKVPVTPLKYIGPLSRFTSSTVEKNTHILILLSGPEPQRSILESLLLNQLKNFSQPVVFVRGLPKDDEEPKILRNVTIYNHLPAKALEEKISESSFVISRSGYSTVMDMMALQKKSILIATPGQPEQEYLSKHLMKNNLALCIPQKKFLLKAALDLAATFNYRFRNFNNNKLDEIIDQFVQEIQLKKSMHSSERT
ncbi:MAG: glycosyltransferase [Flavisolibacter sp.]